MKCVRSFNAPPNANRAIGACPSWRAVGGEENQAIAGVTAIASDMFPGEAMGAVNGAMGSAFGAGAAVFPWLAGWLFDQSRSYSLAFAAAAVAVIISTAAVWIATMWAKRSS